MTMINQAYDVLRQIQNNISQTDSIKGIKTLIQGKNPNSGKFCPRFICSSRVYFTHFFVLGCCLKQPHRILQDNNSPQISHQRRALRGTFQADLVMPMNGFNGLEAAFMKTLKESIATAQKVWG
jgi:hypothetical protein